MRVILKLICGFVCFGMFAFPLFGATIYLNSGESLSGQIQRMDEESLFLESEYGFGILQIARSDIQMIEFEETKRDLTRKVGLGFYQRNVSINAEGKSKEYSVGSASWKQWISSTEAFDFLFGYTSSKGSQNSQLEIINLELRYTHVFLKEGQQNLYYGASLGFMSVRDSSVNLNDSGNTIRGFFGIEFFPLAFPNVGLSTELGFSYQSIGSNTSATLFNVGFPSMSVRYYF